MSGDGETTKKRGKQTLTSRGMLGLRLDMQILARSSANSRFVTVWDVLKGKWRSVLCGSSVHTRWSLDLNDIP